MLTGSVLVVDDSPETLSLLAHALDAEGFRVRTANSVFHALEALHDGSERPSVIITDLMMPQTTGWDFLKHLRSEATLQGVPIIVVTGAEPGEEKAMADLVLRKPIDPGELAGIVRGMLARSEPQ
jgi:DNA-binding response OmpR family regulator